MSILEYSDGHMYRMWILVNKVFALFVFALLSYGCNNFGERRVKHRSDNKLLGYLQANKWRENLCIVCLVKYIIF